MTPTYEELLEGATQFRHQHRSVNILVSFHGFRRPDYSNPLLAEGHPGIWCYYLIIPEQMYPHRWDDFKCTRDENGFEHHGKAFENIRF